MTFTRLFTASAQLGLLLTPAAQREVLRDAGFNGSTGFGALNGYNIWNARKEARPEVLQQT